MSTKPGPNKPEHHQVWPQYKIKAKKSKQKPLHPPCMDVLMKRTDLIPEPKEFSIQLSKRECASLTIDPRAREKGGCMIQDQGQPPEKKTSH